MTVAAALALYVATVLVVGPRLLRRITADGFAPRLAITVWLAAVVTVLGSAVAAVAMTLIEAAGHWDSPDALLTSCIERLNAILVGHSGWPAQIVAILAVAGTLSGLAVVCLRGLRALRRMRAHTLDHADAVRLVGRSDGSDLVVIEAPEPAAYCVAGRPAAIVVTSAAIAALNPQQLAAVIAHERAHLAGRHAHIVAAVRGIAAALPRIGFFTVAATEICALLEMCADDAAALRHGRQPLLAGLLTLAGAVAPAHGLAAASVAVLARAKRLTDPPKTLAQIRHRITLGGAVAAIAATPVAIGLLALSGALMCFA